MRKRRAAAMDEILAELSELRLLRGLMASISDGAGRQATCPALPNSCAGPRRSSPVARPRSMLGDWRRVSSTKRSSARMTTEIFGRHTTDGTAGQRGSNRALTRFRISSDRREGTWERAAVMGPDPNG